MTAADTPAMIRQLFPAGVAIGIAESWMWETPLCEQEEVLFSGASVKRKQEFRAGRHCAHAALAQLGCTTSTVLRGERGEPLWPTGFCGTITHSAKTGVAAVARQPDIEALGMDIEQHQGLKPGVLAKVATAAEITRLKILRQKNPATHYDVLLFSIKEAVYKAYFPLTRQPLGFHDVDVAIEEEEARFVCRVLKESRHAAEPIQGRFIVTDKIVGAAVTIAAQESVQAFAGK